MRKTLSKTEVKRLTTVNAKPSFFLSLLFVNSDLSCLFTAVFKFLTFCSSAGDPISNSHLLSSVLLIPSQPCEQLNQHLNHLYDCVWK
ncbi:hypothetical protein Nepgr_029477 [Nepenthes gracilis]|uniref:Uncharacterized protein n=1 Tax=Nepenthes gracilis TaxID=150966 RepID=A0AAD3TEI7_NEPGR|nr:hypothetical protein Nepgr_029477 [Nepenthes gracilis]